MYCYGKSIKKKKKKKKLVVIDNTAKFFFSLKCYQNFPNNLVKEQ